jgi:hypothetical protein
MWKPINERPEDDKALDNETVLARHIGLKGWFLMRNSTEAHLKRVDREDGYEKRHKDHCEMDDAEFLRHLYEERLGHFTT